ncbi:hypothetical protein B425_3687 [Bacillus amyloliquefaciens]|nr:hypothetical protein B425_3687 [Bacillus amyloliquefaciens]
MRIQPLAAPAGFLSRSAFRILYRNAPLHYSVGRNIYKKHDFPPIQSAKFV